MLPFEFRIYRTGQAIFVGASVAMKEKTEENGLGLHASQRSLRLPA
jgi:hypothetical protein